MFFKFLNNENIFVDEKYWPFLYLFELHLTSLIIEKYDVLLTISKEDIIAFIKKEIFITGPFPTFIEIPTDSLIGCYLEMQLQNIIEEAKRQKCYEQKTGKRTNPIAIDADMLIFKIQQSNKFDEFLKLLSAYNEGECNGRLYGLKDAIIQILENKFGELPDTIYDTISHITDINHIQKMMEYTLSCESMSQIEEMC
ncbi:MAG: hypothetical protein LBE13_04120 [Bacteroidales bacterium]|jgi:hypothetical protein|nr:hypothetical protein [Bacteroidales bacterium]